MARKTLYKKTSVLTDKIMHYCPGCAHSLTQKIIAELIEEHPEWAEVVFEKIDENEHPEIADQYDYYANPSMFIGKEKLYEAHLRETKEECRAHVMEVFRRAME